MRMALRIAALSLFGIVALPVFAADEKKTDEKKDVDKKAPELVAAGTITGKVLHVDESKKTIKLRVPEINQGEAQAIVNLQNEIARIQLTERNPVNARNAILSRQNEIAKHQARLYSSHKDIDFQGTDDLTVRRAELPPKFDEKGKIVPYTAEEKKALKGDDPKAKDYKAEFSDLRPDQQVTLVLMKKKGKPVLPKAEPGKEVDKSDIAAVLAEFEPKVTKILIVAEPPLK
jgi:hypothetical protein